MSPFAVHGSVVELQSDCLTINGMGEYKMMVEWKLS